MKTFLGGALCLVLASSVFAIDTEPAFVLQNAGPSIYGNIFGLVQPESDPSGDTFSSAPLVQDAASAFFISDTAPSTHTFDGTAEDGGADLVGNEGDRFVVAEAFTPGAGANGGDLIQVQYTAVDAAGAPTPWVAAGVAGPAGPFTAWRLDVGSNAGGMDQIANTTAVLGSGMTVFDSAGGPVGSFPLTLDTSSATGVSGLGVIGLGGADIAGFDLASFQLFWEVAPVPEPSSVILGSSSLLGLVLLRRRR